MVSERVDPMMILEQFKSFEPAMRLVFELTETPTFPC